jgi:hypothetical protein
MGRKLRQAGLMTLVLVFAVGCTKPAVQHKEAPDPLLISKKPVEGRQRSPEAVTTALNEPPPPPLPGREPAPVSVQGDSPNYLRPVLLGVEGLPGDPPPRRIDPTDR